MSKQQTRYGLILSLMGIVIVSNACVVQRSARENIPAPPDSQAVVAAGEHTVAPAPSQPQVVAAVNALPFDFEENRGQVDARVKYLARTRSYTLFLTSTETVLASGPTSLRMSFAGGNGQPQLTAEEPLPGTVNYYLGNDPTRWHTDIPTYGKVRYSNAYPGIDVVYYGHGGKVEYDLVVQPGADPNQIRMRFVGAEDAKLDGQGNVVLYVPGGEVQILKPQIYQEVDGKRQEVKGAYQLLPVSFREPQAKASAVESWDVGVTLAAYDKTKPLVIDPVLSYASYFGGNGSTPNPPPPQPNDPGLRYRWGTDDGVGIDNVYGGGNILALDNQGYIYFTGQTNSDTTPDVLADFPVTPGAFQTIYKGQKTDCLAPEGSPSCEIFPRNAFVVKLTPDGTQKVYATYLGGSFRDYAGGIAVDSAGNAYVTGVAYSTFTDASHPEFFPFDTIASPSVVGSPGEAAIFIAKFNATGSKVFISRVGGSGDDAAYGIRVDSSGNSYITGWTTSTDFPRPQGVWQTFGGVRDAFLTKVNFTGTQVLYGTYLGGSNDDRGFSLDLDKTQSNIVYVGGRTSSSDFRRGITSTAVQTSYQGGAYDGFVAKLNLGATGTQQIVYATYLGGRVNGVACAPNELYCLCSPTQNEIATDAVLGIAVDSAGNAYVTGRTGSGDFPVTLGAQQEKFAGYCDAFVTKLNSTGTGLAYSTYLGGRDFDSSPGIGVDSQGNAYVTGRTDSANFPFTQSDVPSSPDGTSGFITKYTPTGKIEYSTRIGGSGNDEGFGIAVDDNRGIYAVGLAYSRDLPLGVAPLQANYAGGASDVLIIRVLNKPTFTISVTDPLSTPTSLVFRNVDSSGQEKMFTLTNASNETVWG